MSLRQVSDEYSSRYNGTIQVKANSASWTQAVGVLMPLDSPINPNGIRKVVRMLGSRRVR